MATRRYPNESASAFFNRQRFRDQCQDEVKTAKGYQRQHPDLSWSECLRLAHKHVSADYRIL